MNSGPDERPQPSGGRAPDEFDAIVASWAREGSVPQWPDEPSDDQQPGDQRADSEAAADPEPEPDSPSAQVAEAELPTAAPLFSGPRDHVEPTTPDDETYIPPEPPPLPRLGPPAIVGLVLLALGLVLVIVPGWVGVGPAYGLPLGLLSLAAGLGWLVLRLWPDPHNTLPPDRGDDGAVL